MTELKITPAKAVEDVPEYVVNKPEQVDVVCPKAYQLCKSNIAIRLETENGIKIQPLCLCGQIAIVSGNFIQCAKKVCGLKTDMKAFKFFATEGYFDYNSEHKIGELTGKACKVVMPMCNYCKTQKNGQVGLNSYLDPKTAMYVTHKAAIWRCGCQGISHQVEQSSQFAFGWKKFGPNLENKSVGTEAVVSVSFANCEAFE